MIPFIVFHCLVLAFLVYRITTYYYCFLNSLIDFCTTILLLTKYLNLEWAALDQVDALWYWRLKIKVCLAKAGKYVNLININLYKNVMITFGPGWQIMDPFGLWLTYINETFRISFFLTGSLNGGIRFEIVFSCFFKFRVPDLWKFDKNKKMDPWFANLAQRWSSHLIFEKHPINIQDCRYLKTIYLIYQL